MVLKKNKSDVIMADFFCDTCGAKVFPDGLFCSECAPPILPIEEPEEIGISFEQALIRIFILLLLFVSIAVIKLDLSMLLIEGKEQFIEPFDVTHTVIPQSANIRSRASINSKVIGMVNQGMNLVVIESNDSWSKVHAFEKTGWIASRLIKPKIQAKK